MTVEGFESVRDKLRQDPVIFAEAVLGFHAFPYQAELLCSQSKRVVACWARQTGKTTAIAIKVIHFAFTNAKTTTLIVSRGLRQSMIMFGVIEHLILRHPVLRRFVVKSTRTSIQLKNGSQIIAFPCGPDGASLRSYDLIGEDQMRADGKIAGNYFLGADFGKRVDYSVVVLLKEEEGDRFRLVLLKQFKLGTPYTDVTAFIQRLDKKFRVQKGFVDQSAVGESLIEEISDFASQIEGLTFTAKAKQDLMILLQTRMEQKRLILPMDRTLLSQINEQQYRFGKTKLTEKPDEPGVMTFYHPSGTHDDQLWALGLAVYATKERDHEPFIYLLPS